jgi:hypothetical protein
MTFLTVAVALKCDKGSQFVGANHRPPLRYPATKDYFVALDFSSSTARTSSKPWQPSSRPAAESGLSKYAPCSVYVRRVPWPVGTSSIVVSDAEKGASPADMRYE